MRKLVKNRMLGTVAVLTLVVVLGVFMTGCNPGNTSPYYGTVFGRVVDIDGNGIEGATVYYSENDLYGEQEEEEEETTSRALPSSVTTDADGDFMIEGLVRGEHELRIDATGYFEQRNYVDVTPEDIIDSYPDATMDFTTEYGEETSGYIELVANTGQIDGILYAEIDPNLPESSSNATVLTEATIEVTYNGNLIGTFTSDATTGAFSLTGLPVGDNFDVVVYKYDTTTSVEYSERETGLTINDFSTWNDDRSNLASVTGAEIFVDKASEEFDLLATSLSTYLNESNSYVNVPVGASDALTSFTFTFNRDVSRVEDVILIKKSPDEEIEVTSSISESVVTVSTTLPLDYYEAYKIYLVAYDASENDETFGFSWDMEEFKTVRDTSVTAPSAVTIALDNQGQTSDTTYNYGDTSVDLTWNSVAGVDVYRIYGSVDGIDYTYLGQESSDGDFTNAYYNESADLTAIDGFDRFEDGQTVSLKVIAKNDGGVSGDSNVITVSDNTAPSYGIAAAQAFFGGGVPFAAGYTKPTTDTANTVDSMTFNFGEKVQQPTITETIDSAEVSVYWVWTDDTNYTQGSLYVEAAPGAEIVAGETITLTVTDSSGNAAETTDATPENTVTWTF